jgi:cytoskeletal protein CcmA (bactofilin family)
MAQARVASRASADGRDARIGAGTRVRGRIAGDGDLTIEGEVEGDISLRGNLTIAEGGTATSEVEAQSVVVEGTLEGNVSASGKVRVASGARVRGNLRGEAVSIDEGAQFAGRLECEFELPKELGGGGSEGGRARR